MRDMYYFDPKRIDIGVLRSEARRLSSVTDRWHNATDVVIHHHDYEDKCTLIAYENDDQHEFFPKKEAPKDIEPQVGRSQVSAGTTMKGRVPNDGIGKVLRGKKNEIVIPSTETKGWK